MDYEYIINDNIEKNRLIKINDKIYLNVNQIEVLKKYQIPYETCSSFNELIFYIEEVLNECDLEMEDLENVSLTLSELDYYQNYHK